MMKHLTAIMVAGMFSLTACAKEEPKKVEAAPAATAAAPETKRVCKDVVKDGKPVKNKDGSVKQECRTIKIHKKHEGTKVPPK